MKRPTEIMEYTDDEFIEYIECLEKALDKACSHLELETTMMGNGKWNKDKWKEWLMNDEQD